MGFQYVKPPIEPFKWARNGKYPDAAFQADLAEYTNHAALYRLKEIASFGMTTDVIASPAAESERVRWRTRYEPSPYAAAIMVRGWLAQSTLENSSADPYALVTIDGISETATAEMHYGAATTENANPDHMAVLTTFATESGVIYTPNQSLTYDIQVGDVQSRIAACTIYEVSLNTISPCREGYAVHTPILYIDRGEVVVALRDMWKTQAAPLFTWTVDDQASPRTRTSTTPINLIDNSSTSVTTATVGFTIDLRNRARASTGTVPVKMWAYGSSAGSTGGTVYLRNSAGGAEISIGSIKTVGWYSATANLPATRAKYDLHFAGDGTNQVSIFAVNLVQFLA